MHFRDHVLPKQHVSVLERVIDAPAGYSPGNIPAQSQLVGRPTPVVEKAAIAMRAMLGQQPSLLDRARTWIAVRVWSQRATMTAALLVAVMALREAMGSPAWSWSALMSAEGLAGIALASVSGALHASRWNVLGLLSVMTLAYAVGWLASARMGRIFSEFWFKVRP
jgi:hypothetical protein